RRSRRCCAGRRARRTCCSTKCWSTDAVGPGVPLRERVGGAGSPRRGGVVAGVDTTALAPLHRADPRHLRPAHLRGAVRVRVDPTGWAHFVDEPKQQAEVSSITGVAQCNTFPTKKEKRVNPKVDTKTEHLSPGDAKALLELNVNNRHVYQQHVVTLRNHMLAGRWKFNGDTIRLSPS